MGESFARNKFRGFLESNSRKKCVTQKFIIIMESKKIIEKIQN